MLKRIEFLSREKLAESDVQIAANHVDSQQDRALALAVQDIFDAGQRERRQRSQMVDGDTPFIAKLKGNVLLTSDDVKVLEGILWSDEKSSKAWIP